MLVQPSKTLHREPKSISQLFRSLHFSILCLSLAQTCSHLWWGGVLSSINSRLHAKIHYANLLFLCTQACQLTCGTNFSLLHLFTLPPAPCSPQLLLISMFRIHLHQRLCVKRPALYRWTVISHYCQSPLCFLHFSALKPSGHCLQNANNADIVTSPPVIVQR